MSRQRRAGPPRVTFLFSDDPGVWPLQFDAARPGSLANPKCSPYFLPVRIPLQREESSQDGA